MDTIKLIEAKAHNAHYARQAAISADFDQPMPEFEKLYYGQ